MKQFLRNLDVCYSTSLLYSDAGHIQNLNKPHVAHGPQVPHPWPRGTLPCLQAPALITTYCLPFSLLQIAFSFYWTYIQVLIVLCKNITSMYCLVALLTLLMTVEVMLSEHPAFGISAASFFSLICFRSIFIIFRNAKKIEQSKTLFYFLLFACFDFMLVC